MRWAATQVGNLNLICFPSSRDRQWAPPTILMVLLVGAIACGQHRQLSKQTHGRSWSDGDGLGFLRDKTSGMSADVLNKTQRRIEWERFVLQLFFFSLSPASLHTAVIPLLWVCLSLGSSFHEGTHSALRTFQVQLSACKEAKTGWPMREELAFIGNWSSTLKETHFRQRHHYYSFCPFCGWQLFVTDCFNAYPRKHFVKPLP